MFKTYRYNSKKNVWNRIAKWTVFGYFKIMFLGIFGDMGTFVDIGTGSISAKNRVIA